MLCTPMASSLASFDENSPAAVINSPRSLQACKQEGVKPIELTYKPIEAFQEKNLSPRLVKLRYDFFEAKRRDLLAAARRARESIVADERRSVEKSSHQLAVIAQESGLSKRAIMALKSDGLELERKKQLKAQEMERNWLKNALQNELRQVKILEANKQKVEERSNSEQDKIQEAARRNKELTDRRQQEEEQKQLEVEARSKLEKQIAKEEFLRQQEELKAKAEAEAAEQKRLYERQLVEMDRKKQAEIEKAEKREAAFREQEAKKAEMRAQELRRMEILEQQRQATQEALEEKKDVRDMRIYQTIQANAEAERRRREEFEEKQRLEQEREERLMQQRALEQEENAKKAFQLMMRRKVIQEDAARKQEERRMAILETAEETEFRLLDHEQKKERYLDFKRELDSLRGKNKEINVERQRRREEANRELVAEQVRQKDEKIKCINEEKKRLWAIRRQAQSEAYRARELVKHEIMRQRVTSKFDSKSLEKLVLEKIDNELFKPKVLKTSTSLPVLEAALHSTQAYQVDEDAR